MIRKIFILIILYSGIYQPALAIGMTVTERQLNTIVNLRFPIIYNYMEYKLEASNPSLKLYEATQSVAIKSRINVNQINNSIIADVTFKGKIAFDKATNSLKVSDPLITQFKVISNNFPKSTTSLNAITKVVGQHLPIAMLIDFNQLDNQLFRITPASISIVKGGLRVEY